MGDGLTYEWPAALVTGGGTGLGQALALRLVAAGIEVAIVGRRLEPLIETRNLAGDAADRLRLHTCDLRDAEACTDLIEEIGETGMLVNNAAGTFVAKAEDISPNGWRAVVDSTLNAPFYVTSAWGKRRIREGQGGVVVNIASATTDGGSPGTVHSGAAKAGLISMTKTLAMEWARFGIRVNALSPGPFETPGAASWIWKQDRIRARVESSVPLGYIAPLDEIVHPALFLLSTAARYATGSVLKVDGGWTLTHWLYVHPDDLENA
jgi:NAD(P)-dependent dehydrogenase (short-subunit alcohol dehydrogenase family)